MCSRPSTVVLPHGFHASAAYSSCGHTQVVAVLGPDEPYFSLLYNMEMECDVTVQEFICLFSDLIAMLFPTCRLMGNCIHAIYIYIHATRIYIYIHAIQGYEKVTDYTLHIYFAQYISYGAL